MAAESSRCLYASYRYESPPAGFEAGTSTHPQADCRQTGSNFGGLHYTLFRHYDPVQMRFTGPDPAASPFHNLHAYCGNNPAGAYDPDGLNPVDGPAIWSGGSEYEGQGETSLARETAPSYFAPKDNTGTWRDFWFGASYEAREILTGKYSAWGMVTGKGLYGHFVSEEEFAADYAVDTNTTAFQGGRIAVVVVVEVTAAVVTGGLSSARLAPTALRATTLLRVEQRAATVLRTTNVVTKARGAPAAVAKLTSLRQLARTKGTDLYKLVSKQRRSAVQAAWAEEQALVRGTGKGTRRWTDKQMHELLRTGKVRGYQGHHINSVRNSPYMASMSSNIEFTTRAQHLRKHGGHWQNPTRGELLDRFVGVGP